MPNADYTDAEVQGLIRQMRIEGWTVKFDYYCGRDEWATNSTTRANRKVWVSYPKCLGSFKANRGPINFRGCRISNFSSMDGWNPDVHAEWSCKFYIRNANGGYNKAEMWPNDITLAYDLDWCISHAKELHATTQDPAIISRSQLPDPLPLMPTPNRQYWRQRETTFGDGEDKTPALGFYFETMAYSVHVMGVVSIAGDCSVSVIASTTPGNKAWFLVSCAGTKGNFKIITDGDSFHPIRHIGRKRENQFKISDVKVENVDLSRWTQNDGMNVKQAVTQFANWYAEQFK